MIKSHSSALTASPRPFPDPWPYVGRANRGKQPSQESWTLGESIFNLLFFLQLPHPNRAII